MPRKGAKLAEEAAKKNAAATGGSYKKVATMEEAFDGADIVYPKSWALSIRVRREKAAAYRELASRRGQSLSSIVWQYLDAECEKEGIVTE